MRTALVVPSLRRPKNVLRLADTLERTCQGDTDLYVGLDSTDPTASEYPIHPRVTKYVVRPDLNKVVAWINFLAKGLTKDYDIIGHVGDDNTFDTPGWDLEIAKALEQTPFAFGNDLYPRPPGSLCCHIFMRSEVVDRLGYFGPPVLKHMYVDPVWMAWGKATGITYLHHVQIEHHHYSNQKASFDTSYASSTGVMTEDFIAYAKYCRPGPDGKSQLNEDILKIDPNGRQYTPDELAIFQQGLSIQW